MHDAAVLDELKVGGLTLRGITRGGVETCLMVPELGVMFDVMRGGTGGEPERADGRLSLGIPGPYFCEFLEADVRRALENARAALLGAGHDVREVEIEHARWTPDVYLHIVLPEAARYHAISLEQHAGSYSPGVRLRLEMGSYVLAEDYLRAMRVREALTARVDRALESCDALLLPAMPCGAPLLGATSITIDGRSEPVRAAMLRQTQLFNLTGHPAIVLPAGIGRDGLPRSLQLVGRRHATDRLLAVARRAADQISGGPGSVGGGTG